MRNESIYSNRWPEELPDPPDNVEEWEQLPEAFREVISDRIENGIANEWAKQCERDKRKARVIGARYKEAAKKVAA